MKIQYSNWQQIDLNTFRQGLDETLIDKSSQASSILDDGSFINGYTVFTNSLIGGFWGGYEYQIKGSNFFGNNPAITSILIQSDTEYLKASGRFTENRVGDIVGSISAIEYTNSNLNSSYKFIGKANEFSFTGTTTYALSGNKYSITGSFNTGVNGNVGIDDVTSGTITGFSFEDTSGHKISVSDLSLDYVTFKNLTDSSSTITSLYSILNFDGNDTVTGTSGDDDLDGGAGADKLIGGLGDDTYIVDLLSNGKLQDKITEAKNAGIDTLELSGDLILSKAVTLKTVNNVENIDISHTNNSLLNITGDKANNTLTDNAANNVIDGGAGADAMQGGAGDDAYVIDSFADVVTESQDAGVDTIQIKIKSAGTYSLTDHLENANLFNAKAFDLIGNDLNNTLIGNGAANRLEGGLGNDALSGGKGHDILNGGKGDDVLTGGLGADIFRFMAADIGTAGNPTIDTITDFKLKEKDVLDFRDLQFLVSKNDTNSLLNYMDFSVSGANTELHVSLTGGFADGYYNANAEYMRIVFAGVNLLTTVDESELIASLISKNQLLIE